MIRFRLKNIWIRNRYYLLFILMVVGVGGFILGLEHLDAKTSSDSSCMSCHVHPKADHSWKISSHHNNKSGVVVHCVDCHLPPKNHADYWPHKLKAASRDLYSYWFKDPEQLNWEQKSTLEYATNHTFEVSCINCHENLFPLHLSKKGDEAHLYYKNNQEALHCINCHLNVGHGEKKAHMANVGFLKTDKKIVLYSAAAQVNQFSSFKETVPGTSVSFEMIAIPSRKYGKKAELGEEVKSDRFFMGKIEVSWDEYRAFLSETESEGRTHSIDLDVDAISGATPPFGDPSQGWGMGRRPAITMTWHAAQTYCRWLSQKTGKNYRLPTATEWEYACRAGVEGDYFFGGIAKDYEPKGFLRKIFGKTSGKINEYVIWAGNSEGKTHLPENVKPNAFGLLNMQGNVKEFCSDWDEEKREHVVMGGSFKSSAENLKIGNREFTQHDEWMKTDPQIPKSIWWYSDCNDVGFRVVCEWPVDGKGKTPDNSKR